MQPILDWIWTQVKSPTTYASLAAFVASLMTLNVIDPHVGAVATGVLSALGILVKEAGEGK